MKNHARSLSLLLAALLASASLGCGETGPAEDATAAADLSSTAAPVDPDHLYPEADYGGYKFRFLNSVNYYGARAELDFESLSGEVLNDAIYNRNRAIEERYNIEIAVDDYDAAQVPFKEVVTLAQTAIMAGDDTWDVCYISNNVSSPLITSGCVHDLNTVKGLNLDKPWWDQIIIQNAQIGGKLFFATGAAHLMAYEMTDLLFFNSSMMKDLKLELPYQTVRDGEWTIDKMKEYATAAASLNGADSWAWDPGASTVYGLSAHASNSANKLLVGMGTHYISLDGGKITFMPNADHTFTALEKLAALYDTASGVTIKGNTDDLNAEKGGYVHIFREGRALFLTSPLKAVNSLRDMKDDYGLLPYPKLDEKQEQYNSFEGFYALGMTIPVTNKDLERTAVIMDALCYDSYRDVIPIYYNVMLSQKLLRDEESIEMMELINAARTTDLALLYGWTPDLVTTLNSKMFAGDPQLASDIESNRAKVEANAKAFVDSISG